MIIGRRVLAIMIALAVLFLVSAPARADRAQRCRIGAEGAVFCDGDGGPVRVGVTGKVVQIVAAGNNTCALTEPGTVYCWSFEPPAPPTPASPPLLLLAVGSLLVAAGLTLVLVARSSV